MAGYDLEVDAPVFVPLDIALELCVAEGYYRSSVKEALLGTLSNRTLISGEQGFFHPDRFTFGRPVYLSQLYAAILKIPGVASVDVTRFQRWGKAANHELENGVLSVGRLEIARLDNDPNFPENGRLELILKGGL
jgi:hypothetical protein